MLHVDDKLTDVPSLDNSSPKSVPNRATHGSTATSAKTMRISTWIFRHPPSLTQWPRPFHLVRLPFSISHTAALLRMLYTFHRYLLPLQFSTILPTSPQLSSNSPVIGSSHVPSHSSLIAPAAPSRTRHRVSSAPDLGSDAEGEGDAMDALHKEKDTCDSPLTVRGVTVTSDLSPQLPPLPSVGDVGITSPPRLSLDTEQTGDSPRYPSHGQYTIV
ncbi:hypothetical protein EI94DRAFT_1812689 [Lactarius quietus]|nr:hypothetical protein EI94DRAFT_1812689 [Lactarius quietus]